MIEPIRTLHLFEPLEQKLVELLHSLSSDDWKKPTVAKQWTVKDVAAHLLDTSIRTIAQSKEFVGDPPEAIDSYADLVSYLNRLNADWVKAMKRVSPETLIELLTITQKPMIDSYHSLELWAPARFPVSWAGERESKNWFHIAREYTERWHHQQQIRDAVKKEGIMGREFFFPMIDTFMQALPHTYRQVQASEGTVVRIIIPGDAGGAWNLQRTSSGWKLTGDAFSTAATVELGPDTAWKLFTKVFTRREAESLVKITGNRELGVPLLGMVSVMA